MWLSVSLVMYPCLVRANVYTESPLCSLSQEPVTMTTSAPDPHTPRLWSRDKLIHLSLSLSFIIQSNHILQHEQLIKLLIPTLIQNTHLFPEFLSNYQTYLVANFNFFQQSLQNTFSYLYERIFNTHFSYPSHWCQTGRAGSGVMPPGWISLTHSNWAEQTLITLATPPQSQLAGGRAGQSQWLSPRVWILIVESGAALASSTRQPRRGKAGSGRPGQRAAAAAAVAVAAISGPLCPGHCHYLPPSRARLGLS